MFNKREYSRRQLVLAMAQVWWSEMLREAGPYFYTVLAGVVSLIVLPIVIVITPFLCLFNVKRHYSILRSTGALRWNGIKRRWVSYLDDLGFSDMEDDDDAACMTVAELDEMLKEDDDG